MKKQLLTIAALITVVMGVQGQSSSSKAWEFGLGGNVQSLKRIYIDNYERLDHVDAVGIDERNAVFGAQLYVAKELNRHFYLDFQGNLDFADDHVVSGNKTRVVITPTIGLQWRLGSYMRNRVIDPFVRAGVGYQYRNFTATSVYNFADNETSVSNSSRHLSPVAFGAGSNLWISNNWGIGLEADYILLPQKNVDNQWQGSVRVIYRIGGEEKVMTHNQNDLAEIARLNDQVNAMRSRLSDCEAERARLTADLANSKAENMRCADDLADARRRLESASANSALLPVIQFGLNSAKIPALQRANISIIAKWIKENNATVTISGYADRKTGNAGYNMDLSRRRAEAIKAALVEYGVDPAALNVEAEGCETQPFETNSWNRVVMFETAN